MTSFQITEMPVIPYYYECHLPLIDEVIRHSGSYSSLGLLSNSLLYGVPVLSTGDAIRLEQIRKLLGSKLECYSLRPKAFPHLEEGLRSLQDILLTGQPVIVSGTSYCLPYHDDYQNPVYIEKHVGFGSDYTIQDHWLLVTGIDGDQVQLYDPVPSKYIGVISLSDFIAFWSGNRSIEALQTAKGFEKLESFGMMEVIIHRSLSDENQRAYFNHVLTALVREYERGFTCESWGVTYAFGRSAFTRLRGLLEEVYLHAPGDLWLHAKPIFDIRWSHYYWRDLLQEMATMYGQPYLSLLERELELIQSWENLFKTFTLYTQRQIKEPHRFEKILSALDRLIQEEDTFYYREVSRILHSPQESPYGHEQTIG